MWNNLPETEHVIALFCPWVGLIIWLFDGEWTNVVESTKLPTKLSTAVRVSCLMATTVIVCVFVFGLGAFNWPPLEPAVITNCVCCWMVDGGDACWLSPLPLPTLWVVARVKRISDMETGELLLSGMGKVSFLLAFAVWSMDSVYSTKRLFIYCTYVWQFSFIFSSVCLKLLYFYGTNDNVNISRKIRLHRIEDRKWNSIK